jgi:hypothetical protein
MWLSIKLKYYFAPVLKYPKTVIPAQEAVSQFAESVIPDECSIAE